MFLLHKVISCNSIIKLISDFTTIVDHGCEYISQNSDLFIYRYNYFIFFQFVLDLQLIFDLHNMEMLSFHCYHFLYFFKYNFRFVKPSCHRNIKTIIIEMSA